MHKGPEPAHAWRIAAVAALAFLTENLVMLAFQYLLPGLPRWAENFLDALILTAVTLPAIYWLLFRPYLRQLRHRRRADRLLGESEERYRFLFDAAPVGIEVATLEGETLASNRAMQEITGSQGIFFRNSFVDPEEHDRLLEHLRRNGRCRDREVRLERPDRPSYWVLLNVDIVDLDGTLAFFTTARDVTQSRLAAEELRKLAGAVEQTADSVVITDLDGNIEYVNPAFERLTGFSREEALGSTPRILKSGRHDLKTYQDLWSTILAGHVYRAEFVNRKKNGELFHQEATITPITDREGRLTHFVNTSKDVTERKLAEERIRRQLDRITALRTIDMAISGSLDLSLTLSVLLDHAAAELGVSAAHLFVLNPRTLLLETSSSRGFQSESRPRARLRVGQGHAGRSALERTLVHVPDLRGSPGDPARAALFAKEGFINYHAVPLLARGQVKGVLEVFDRGAREVDEEWREFLQALASQAAIAIDSVTLFNDVQRSNLELTAAYDATLEGWVRALDLRDRETEGHTQRVTELSVKLARAFGFSDEELVHVRRGALLHDIGKIAIPDEILLKPGRLSTEEFEVIKRHPVYAYEFLSPIPYLRPALDIPYCHHEKWDGTGYPRGLAGEFIPFAARIFAVVDVWDALRSERPYHASWPAEKVCELIQAQSGKHFDPEVVRRFLPLVTSELEPAHL